MEKSQITNTERDALVARLEAEVRPLIDKEPHEGGYDCCGCSTYNAILDHAIAIAKGER